MYEEAFSVWASFVRKQVAAATSLAEKQQRKGKWVNEEQEVSVNLASAKEISLTVAELSELGGILNLKQEKRKKER